MWYPVSPLNPLWALRPQVEKFHSHIKAGVSTSAVQCSAVLCSAVHMPRVSLLYILKCVFHKFWIYFDVFMQEAHVKNDTSLSSEIILWVRKSFHFILTIYCSVLKISRPRESPAAVYLEVYNPHGRIPARYNIHENVWLLKSIYQMFHRKRLDMVWCIFALLN
jgi:hypothetical protein